MVALRLASFVATLIVSTLASAQQGTPRTVALQIDEVIQSHAAAEDFSGSVLVARDGRILWSVHIVVLYKNQKGTRTAEFMEFGKNGKIIRVVANYSA